MYALKCKLYGLDQQIERRERLQVCCESLKIFGKLRAKTARTFRE